MNYKNIIFDNFKENFLPILSNEKKIVIAVSGGADSMCLLLSINDFINKNNLNIQIFPVTVDHKLRRASREEAMQVSKWCKKIGLNHELLTWEHSMINTKIQEAARNARYDLLLNFCLNNQINILTTAHHADDQFETFIMRLKRGSSTRGLSCMEYERKISVKMPVKKSINSADINDPSKENDASANEISVIRLIRPFLNIESSVIKNCLLNDYKHPWINDPSNENIKYERIRIRKKDFSDISSQNVIKSLLSIQETESFIRKEVEKLKQKSILNYQDSKQDSKQDSVKLYLKEIKEAEPIIAKRLLQSSLESISKKNATCPMRVVNSLYKSIILDNFKSFAAHRCLVRQIKNEIIEIIREKDRKKDNNKII